MSLRREGRSNELVTARDLDGRSAIGPARPSLVIATHFRESARWDPELIAGSRAALPLVDNTVRARSVPRQTMKAAASIARHAATLLGDRGDATDLLAALSSRITIGAGFG